MTELEKQNATLKRPLAGAKLEKAAPKEPGEDNFRPELSHPPVPIGEQLLEKEEGVSLVGLSCCSPG